MEIKTLYWLSTSLLCLILAASVWSYFFSQATIDGVRDLGFPDFFRVQLGVLKIIAIIVLLLPIVPLQAKEWAYAGVTLFFITAIVAHIAHGDSPLLTVMLVGFLILVAVSNFTLHRLP